MIFSSYYQNSILKDFLPKVGDIVSYNVSAQRNPQKITRRFRRCICLDHENAPSYQIYVELEKDPKPYPIEVIAYWPKVRDLVEISSIEYLEFIAEKYGKDRTQASLGSHTFNIMRVLAIRNEMATLKPLKDDQIFEIPCKALRVVEVMGIRAQLASGLIKNLANPEKVKPDSSTVEEFKERQRKLLAQLEA